MYNGIGLSTPRGSGTSGYVQTNKFNIRSVGHRNSHNDRNAKDTQSLQVESQKPNQKILDHMEKRKVEAQIFQYEEDLRDEGYSEEEIKVKSLEFRQQLYEKQQLESKQTNGVATQPKQETQDDTHIRAKKKKAQMEKLRNAFGFNEDPTEGEAFDQELQQVKKEKRKLEREAREEEKQKEQLKKAKKELKELKREQKRLKREKKQQMETLNMVEA